MSTEAHHALAPDMIEFFGRKGLDGANHEHRRPPRGLGISVGCSRAGRPRYTRPL